MPVEVVLPKVDMDMESGVIAQWKVAEGAHVHKGDILFDMETSKSIMEVEAPASGTIRALAPVNGAPIQVGTCVAWIDTSDDAGDAARATPPASVANTRRAKPAAPPRTAVAVVSQTHAGVRATPLARREARARGIDLAVVRGSGPRGRVVAQDVAAHTVPGTAEIVPLSPTQRVVAHRMTQSADAAPHFHLTAHVDMTALRRAREHVAPRILREIGIKPTLNVLLAHIVARVLTRHPRLNASVEGDGIRLHNAVHLGIAVDRDGDLLVPVLRDAHRRTPAELMQDFVRLRNAVRSRSIAPADMRGGTFTISNLGMYGVDTFTAIINPPQSAILAVGRTVDTPVGREGTIVLRPMASLSLSSDHRIVDGVTAARFMADLRRALENPASMEDYA
jgi:pyruvate dehydrogenase E2 component (dihydrolipoamide acetyltransferase)